MTSHGNVNPPILMQSGPTRQRRPIDITQIPRLKGGKGINQKWESIINFSARRAIHNSKDLYDPPKCHPNTRVAIRNRLMDWITQKTAPDAHILWFYGAAGAGKSAIAQTMAEICDEQKLLLASFFFSRTDSTRNTVKPLAATIAYQVGTAIPATQRLFGDVLEKNPTIFSEPFETQLMEFLIQPLLKFAKQGAANCFPRLVIIDGLDECFDPNAQSQIVVALSNVLQSNAMEQPLRFLVVSRPEQHLQETFSSRVPTSMLYRLALDASYVPDSDIRLFLEDQFADIKKNNPVISPGWPIPDTVDSLVRRSCGRFVFASTILKYISSSNDPISSLDTILQLQCPPEEDGMPFAELDVVYSHILSSVRDPQTTKAILGVVLFVDPDYDLFTPLSSAQISATQTLSGVEQLLSLKPDQAEACLAELYPMVQHCPEGNIVVPHATVAEFLNDPTRSKSFHLDKACTLTFLASCCFENIRNNDGDYTRTRFIYGRIPQLCRNIPLTVDLLKDLKGFSLSHSYQWCGTNASHIGVALRRKHLFAWWYVAKFMVTLRQLEAIDAYLHHLSAFDELVRSSLANYPAAEDVHLLLVLATIPSKALVLTQKQVTNLLTQMHVDPLLFVLDGSVRGLGILSMYPEEHALDNDCLRVGRHWNQDIVMDVYHQFLLDFVMDPARSGAYFLSQEAYTAVTLKILQFGSRTSPDCAHTGESDQGSTRSLMSFLPHLLARSSKSKPLLRLLRSKEFLSFLFNSHSPEEIDGVKQSITEYQKRFSWWESFF